MEHYNKWYQSRRTSSGVVDEARQECIQSMLASVQALRALIRDWLLENEAMYREFRSDLLIMKKEAKLVDEKSDLVPSQVLEKDDLVQSYVEEKDVDEKVDCVSYYVNANVDLVSTVDESADFASTIPHDVRSCCFGMDVDFSLPVHITQADRLDSFKRKYCGDENGCCTQTENEKLPLTKLQWVLVLKAKNDGRSTCCDIFYSTGLVGSDGIVKILSERNDITLLMTMSKVSYGLSTFRGVSGHNYYVVELFGVTTACVSEVQEKLNKEGFETIVFEKLSSEGSELNAINWYSWLGGIIIDTMGGENLVLDECLAFVTNTNKRLMNNAKIVCVACDVCKLDDVKRFSEVAKLERGLVAICLNNVGIAVLKSLTTFSTPNAIQECRKSSSRIRNTEYWSTSSTVIEVFEAKANKLSLAYVTNISKASNPEERFSEYSVDQIEAAIAHRQLIIVSFIGKLQQGIPDPQLRQATSTLKDYVVYGLWKTKNLSIFGVVLHGIVPKKVTDQFLTNVLLQINAKMGGINSFFTIERSAMILLKSHWVYVDNLVTALQLARMGLLKEMADKHKQPIAAGQADFISMVSLCDGMTATISFWKDKKQQMLDGPGFLTWLLVIFGMMLTFYAAYLLLIHAMEDEAVLLWGSCTSPRVYVGSSSNEAGIAMVCEKVVQEIFSTYALQRRVYGSHSRLQTLGNRVSSTFTQVDGCVLQAPKLKFGNKEDPSVHKKSRVVWSVEFHRQFVNVVSAFGPKYDVHDKNLLPKMQPCYQAIVKLLNFCQARKNEMTLFVHNFMQKVADVQLVVKNIQLQFPVFWEAMACQDMNFDHLKLVRAIGQAYRACLAKVVRRKAYMKLSMGVVGQYVESFYEALHTAEQNAAHSGMLSDLKKPIIFSMARLDRVEKLTGIVEWLGKNARLRELVKDHGKELKDIEEQGMDRVRNEELYRCIPDTRGAFVQSALYEAFGLTVVEAMTCGLPAFVPNLDVFFKYIINRKNYVDGLMYYNMVKPEFNMDIAKTDANYSIAELYISFTTTFDAACSSLLEKIFKSVGQGKNIEGWNWMKCF